MGGEGEGSCLLAAGFNLGLADEGSYSWKSHPKITLSLPCASQELLSSSLPWG